MARSIAAAFLLLATTLPGSRIAAAQELRIGVQVETTAIDPQFADLSANSMIAMHIFSSLVTRDDRLRLRPGLATEWHLVDNTTWEFKLRQSITFQDGSSFTAADVKASIERVAVVPNSPSPLSGYVRAITSVEVVDPGTVRFKTKELFTQLPLYMTTIPIMSKAALEAAASPENRGGKLLATTEQINAGKAAIGTGPFRFVEWKRGEQIALERFDGYWGEDKSPWKRVVIKPIPNNGARLAALLSGDVDIIDYVPLSDIQKLSSNDKVHLQDAISTRILFLAMDQARDNSPFITDKAGNPLSRNPLKDLRVRQAIEKAIDRKAIVDRIMEGRAAATAQIMPEGFSGYTANLPVPNPDPEGARKLLADAGYPDGFGITLHSPQNRYPNDAQVAQAIGQMLARIGIATKVDAQPPAVFFPQAAQHTYSFMLTGYGIVTGEPSSFLTFALLTENKERGHGVGNRGQYSNPKLDALFDQALSTVDPAKAEGTLIQATEEVVHDVGFVPLFHNLTTWAMRADLVYPGRTDEYTLAEFVKPR